MSENTLSAGSETIYAGFWRRVTAAVLDQVVLLIGRAVLYGILGAILYAVLYLFEIREQRNTQLAYSIFGGVVLLIDTWLTWIYFAMMESSSLQGSLGKLALGVRVYRQPAGSPNLRALTFEEATVRYFAKIISRATLLIGYILCAFSSKKQALHDFVARSVLIVTKN